MPASSSRATWIARSILTSASSSVSSIITGSSSRTGAAAAAGAAMPRPVLPARPRAGGRARPHLAPGIIPSSARSGTLRHPRHDRADRLAVDRSADVSLDEQVEDDDGEVVVL